MGAMGPKNDPHFYVLPTRIKIVQVQNNSCDLTPLMFCNCLGLVIFGYCYASADEIYSDKHLPL